MIKRALISVSNKEGVVEFAKELDKMDIEIVSTGGTYKLLEENGVKVREMADFTGFPEMMDGRVKTMHPKVAGGLLAVRDNKEHMKSAKENDIEMIDLVVVNLYPFEETIRKKTVKMEEAIENIDIGGPTMLRAAAKNWKYVAAVTDPKDYDLVLKKLQEKDQTVCEETRYYLAQKVFAHTAYYDSLIADYLNKDNDLKQEMSFGYKKMYDLRYGENPHQKSAFYREPIIQEPSIATGKVLQGKQLSYNNIMDADAALDIVKEFKDPAAVVIKHANPAGVSQQDDITEAFEKAYAADSLSAFGGVIALNRDCTKEIAEELAKVFVEIVIAPSFDNDAHDVLAKKKNLRLIEVGPISKEPHLWDMRKVVGGMLIQDLDRLIVTEKDLEVATKIKPKKEDIQEMLFAWKVIKHIKSNGILFTRDMTTVGVGAGQMSRVDSTKVALMKAEGNVEGCILASDAFFPFRDSIDEIADKKIRAIIQPGGSKRDAEVIAACNEHKIPMVFTGSRAFKH
ncbi:bifunctional phosphoribosylaminoimidazolecarboxamide formyltransferase/IMP cyclohydrolase [Patescibacteria group bacterium]|nr:bifunctional phosphoribosylaminoimidazolecarboxamide formyltransferase/IMP cyclohydrolase [Patescibacteria group bacterium]MBU1674022.1 bifunctional phosphoribosylaminoimidazolecarboxamide formyltransferase/IMP cyclohydrolase [Patescibacteria group bacterium]MBU1963176.1 bifunctional phosphoribosylaminoimidazolecarboxamide formyltransferase/IMP cyclohydrolase [Patescibacteria group bacterium]